MASHGLIKQVHTNTNKDHGTMKFCVYGHKRQGKVCAVIIKTPDLVIIPSNKSCGHAMLQLCAAFRFLPADITRVIKVSFEIAFSGYLNIAVGQLIYVRVKR